MGKIKELDIKRHNDDDAFRDQKLNADAQHDKQEIRRDPANKISRRYYAEP